MVYYRTEMYFRWVVNENDPPVLTWLNRPYNNVNTNVLHCDYNWVVIMMLILSANLIIYNFCFMDDVLQDPVVLTMSYQWTQSATVKEFTVHIHRRGTVQVTTVCLVVDRWLFSLTLDVRQTTVNWLIGCVCLVHTGRTGLDL